MPEDLFLFPFGGNARESLTTILCINKIEKRWNIIGFVDDEPSTWGKECCGVKVIGGNEIISGYQDAKVLAVPCNLKNHLQRSVIIESLGVAQARFVKIVHPSVTISPDSTIGYNTIIMPNVVISSKVSIGNHSIILSNSVISHDSTIGDYCCIGSNVTISGNVTVGSMCYIGSGAQIIDNIAIGDKSIVGLGSNVISDIDESVIVAGNPAKVIRKVRLY